MIYGEGKSLEQIQGIVLNMKKNEVENILLTRVSSETYDLVKKIYPNAVYYSSCRLIVIEENPFSKNKGIITIFSGGTTDIPVCEEAAITAEFLGNRIERVYDVGVRLHDEVARIEVIIAKYCHNVIPNLTVKDTICKEKENRENKIRQIIINCKADIIILGDPESINNMKSYKIAMKYCQHVFLIKSIGMLDTLILHDVEHVFVIVNHSVSEDVIKETFNILQSYCDKMKKEFVIEKLPHL